MVSAIPSSNFSVQLAHCLQMHPPNHSHILVHAIVAHAAFTVSGCSNILFERR